MSAGIAAVCWPKERLGEAIEALARHAQLGARKAHDLPRPAAAVFTERTPGEWIVGAAQYLGIEVEPVSARYADVGAMLRGSAPAIVHLPGPEARFLALIGGRRSSLEALGPDLVARRVPLGDVAGELVAQLETSVAPDIEACISAADVRPARRDRMRRALNRERLSNRRIAACYLLKALPGDVKSELKKKGIASNLGLQLAGHIMQLVLMMLAWVVIGRSVFSDHLELGWLLGAMALFLSALPFQLLEQWHAGLATLELGSSLKQRFLIGALRLIPEEIRYDGSGRHLGRVIEFESMQALVLSGAARALMGFIELAGAFVLLVAGAGGALHALLLTGWCVLVAAMLIAYFRRRRAWTEVRLAMTNNTVERMVGYQTRIAQESPEDWHVAEDRELAEYVGSSTRMDRVFRALVSIQNRGWLLLGCAGLTPAFLKGTDTPLQLAIGIGGILLADRALAQLAATLPSLIDAAIAASVVKPLFRAASRRDLPGAPAFALIERRARPGRPVDQADAEGRPIDRSPAAGRARAGSPAPGTPEGRVGGAIVEAHDLVFRYRPGGEPVLRGCSLAIREGDRVLLEGPSGGGKSTLGAILAGLRLPSSGLLSYRGLDYGTLGGEGWRRRIVAAPQFHENHIFTGTLAYNLLMGRAWPAGEADLEIAHQLCRELGLGPLVDRMPSGLQTIVGETGWQLSHGEKSRIYIARALLQDADLIVFDESFAALDPETLERCVRSVLARAGTIVVIAHP